MSTRPVLVAGSTGTTGSALVERLVDRGVPVRALVRPGSSSRTPHATPADLDDDRALAAALRGCAAAYLVTPSSAEAQHRQVRFAEIAAAEGVPHLVKLSQLAADEESPVRFLRYHAAVERRIRELGIGWTFLRPNLFAQGLLGLAPAVRATGVLAAPIGDARVSLVDVRDIADVAAAALTEPGHVGRTYTLTGPAAVTHTEIADLLGVRFADITPEAFAEQLRGVMPPWQVDGLLEDYAHYARGEAAAVSGDVAAVTGRPGRTVAGFAREFCAAFRPSERTGTA